MSMYSDTKSKLFTELGVLYAKVRTNWFQSPLLFIEPKYAHEKVVLISHLFFFSFLLQACASLVNYRHDPKRSSKSPELVIDLTFSNSHKRF